MAQVLSLAWEFPYTMGVAKKEKKKTTFCINKGLIFLRLYNIDMYTYSKRKIKIHETNTDKCEGEINFCTLNIT